MTPSKRNSQSKRNTFILKCFLQFTCINLDGSQKEGVTFKFFSERGGGYPERGGSSLRKVGVPSLEETMNSLLKFCLRLMKSPLHIPKSKKHKINNQIVVYVYSKYWSFIHRGCKKIYKLCHPFFLTRQRMCSQ